MGFEVKQEICVLIFIVHNRMTKCPWRMGWWKTKANKEIPHFTMHVLDLCKQLKGLRTKKAEVEIARNNEIFCNTVWSSRAKPTLIESLWDRHKQAVVVLPWILAVYKLGWVHGGVPQVWRGDCKLTMDLSLHGHNRVQSQSYLLFLLLTKTIYLLCYFLHLVVVKMMV